MTDDRPRGFEADDELLELMESYCNGTISAEGLDRLEMRLASDCSAIRPFVAYLELHSRLRQWSSRTSKALSIPESLAELDRKLVFSPPGEPTKEPSPFSAFSHLTDLRVLGTAGLVAAAVSVLLVFTFTGWLSGPVQEGSRNLQGNNFPLAASDDPESHPPGALPITPVARLTRVWKPKWNEPAGGLQDWSDLHVGEVLELKSGKAEVFFNTGAQLVLRGPFRFEILGANQGRIFYGDAVARVGKNARGFSLITSVGNVIDYGTEFGLSVRPESADLVVFKGEVGLEKAPRTDGPGPTKQADNSELRLYTGESAHIGRDGSTQRIVAINSDRFPRAAFEEQRSSRQKSVINSVSDNIRTPGAGPFYEIVQGGLEEDALAYVDRDYEWNGVTSEGMPEFLLDATYVRGFNSDKKLESYQVTVEFSQPVDCFVFWDDRLSPPKWLTKKFTDTGLDVGMDQCPNKRNHYRTNPIEVGPGAGIDFVHSIWHCRISAPGKITLGDLPMSTKLQDGKVLPKRERSMYGIAAVPIEDSSFTPQSKVQDPISNP